LEAKSILLKYSSVNRFAECLAVGLDSFIGEACPKRNDNENENQS